MLVRHFFCSWRHCSKHLAVTDTAFPRQEIMRALIHVVQHQPRLGKDASSALVDLGQAIHVSASPEEVRLLLQSTLSEEVYVRHSCLQTLQVSMPLIWMVSLPC